MRGQAVLLLACIACVVGDFVKVYSEEEVAPLEELISYEDAQEQQQEPETVFRVDQDPDGSLRVTGMMQSFRLDSDTSSAAFNQLLTRPRTSFLDLSWSNWVDQRMEVLDMFQNLISPIPRCPHMGPDSSSLDTSMVSYLASSRFGPAILTTYAQKFQEEDEDDFDYEEVYIPEGIAFSKSYADASMLDDLSADADKAFQMDGEQDSRKLSQQGFFGANIKTSQDQAMYANQLDGTSESVQPNIRYEPPLRVSTFENLIPEQTNPDEELYFTDPAAADVQQIAGFVVFLLLCLGCLYVWVSLVYSCCRLGNALKAERKAKKASATLLAQQELLAPLMPEVSYKEFSDVEFAASHAPTGTYYAPRGSEYVTIAVPLVNGEVHK